MTRKWKTLAPGTRVRLLTRTMSGWTGTAIVTRDLGLEEDGDRSVTALKENVDVNMKVDACRYQWGVCRDQTGTEDIEAALERVLSNHPGLYDNGFDAKDTTGRIAVEDFHAARMWLKSDRAPPRIKAINANSYALKHLMERQGRRYVTNGAFIAAALSLGIPHKRIPGSLNADFALRGS